MPASLARGRQHASGRQPDLTGPGHRENWRPDPEGGGSGVRRGTHVGAKHSTVVWGGQSAVGSARRSTLSARAAAIAEARSITPMNDFAAEAPSRIGGSPSDRSSAPGSVGKA